MTSESLKIIQTSLAVLEKGGVILYPTETSWGIGCDARNEEAIEKIYDIKKRQKNKPLIIVIHDITLLSNYIFRLDFRRN